MRYIYLLLLSFLLVPFAGLHAQFTLNSAATVISPATPGSNCFQLTPTDFHQKGSVFNDAKIDLNSNFEFNTSLYFGTNDAGGDGIAFVLQAEGTSYIGNHGAGLGYHRFDGIQPSDIPADVPGPVPSFIIEFDTYQNGFIGNQDLGDPAGDHIGFMSNSNAYHTSSNALAAPQEFSANIEDGQWHDARFSWNAATKTMTVQFTVSSAPLVMQTFTYTGDIANTIFSGNSMVYWGFTASNGSYSPNEHRVCITTPPPGDCGQLRTQTPGGWGAPPRGNNPASYMYANFASAFPSGLMVGVSPNYNIKLTSPLAVTNFLPCAGPAKKLAHNYVNPAGSSLKNVLAGHLVALTLSVGFDQADPSFGDAGIQLGQMLIGSGAFSGWTVSDFLVEANKVLGGAASSFTVQQALETAAAINENYVDGSSDKGYLDCPNGPRFSRPVAAVSEIAPVLEQDIRVQPNPSRGQFELQLGNVQEGPARLEIMNINGSVVERRTLMLSGKGQSLRFDLSKQTAGLYLVKITTSKGEQVKKVIIQK